MTKLAKTKILSFPIEITQEIGSLLPRELKTLRLVCSRFNIAFESEVLSTLVISITKGNLKLSTCLLKTLASQKSRVARLARTLKIKHLSPSLPQEMHTSIEHFQDNDSSLKRYLGSVISSINKLKQTAITRESTGVSAEKIMKRYLKSAISSLKNLESVVWVVNSCDPSWTQSTVIDALTGLPHLQGFRLTLHGDPFPLLQLDRLSGLKRISLSGNCTDYRSHIICGLAEAIAKSPQLTHLEVDTKMYDASPETPTLHDLLSKVPQSSPLRLTHLSLHWMHARVDSVTLPHLRSLVSLNLYHIHAPPSTDDESIDHMWKRPSTIPDFYAALNREKIHLKQVLINEIVTDVILDYLGSYSGIEALEFNSISFNSAAESDALSKRLYVSVLPKHVDSIRMLTIRPAYEGGWCYNQHDISQAAVLSQCNKLKSLSVALISVEAPPSADRYTLGYRDVDDTISFLINLSLSLPYVSEISIFSAGLAAHRHSFCGNPIIEHARRVAEIVVRGVTNFKLGDREHFRQVLPDIWVDGYQYRILDNWPGQGYKQSYVTPRVW